MSTLPAQSDNAVKPRQVRRRPISLTTWIFLALFLGIATGLFIGEYAENLKFIGDV